MADSVISILIQGKEQVTKEIKKVNQSLTGLRSAALKVSGALAAAIGVKELVAGIIRTNMEFDKLEAQLATFSDSAADAAGAMKLIQQITSETPFQLNEVTQAFTRMLSLGLTPTRAALKAFGDVAAGSGKSLIQFTEAVADAAVGEFERLKEFGIKASKQGDQVDLVFKGVTRSVKFNATEIQKALEDIGRTEFAGAMERQMNTMEGALSNMKDQFALLARAIGQSGLNEIIISFAKTMRGWANSVLENKKQIQLAFIAIGMAVHKTFATIKYLGTQAFNGVMIIAGSAADQINKVWNSVISAIIKSYNKIAELTPGLEKVNKQMGQLNTTLGADAIQAARTATENYKKEMKAIDETANARADAVISTKQEITSVEELEEKMLAEQAALAKANAERRKQLELQKRQEEFRKKEKQHIDAFNQYVANIEKATRSNQYYVRGQERQLEVIAALEEASKARGRALTEEEKQIVRRAVVQRQTSDAAREAFDKEQEAAKAAAEKTTEYWKNAAQSMQGAMSNFFFDAMQGRMNDLVGSFKSMIDRMVADMLSSQLMDFMFGNFASTGKVGGFLGSMFRANGGPVEAGKPYIVGEQGPEMIVPKFSGTVLDTQSTANAMSQGGNTANINIYAQDSQDVRRTLEKERRWLAELLNGTNATFNLRTA